MVSRRALLRRGAVVSLPFAGCLGESSDRPAESADDTDDVDSSAVRLEGFVRSESAPNRAIGPPAVADDPEREAFAVVVASPDEAERAFRYDGLPEESRGPTRRFVEETEFSRSLLVYVEAVAPSGCEALGVEHATLRDDRVVVAAAVGGRADSDEDCPRVERTARELVRVTFASGRVERAVAALGSRRYPAVPSEELQ